MITRSERGGRILFERGQWMRLLAGLMLGAVTAVAGGCHSAANAELDKGYAALEQNQYNEAMAAADRYLQQNPTGNGTANAMYLRGRAIEQRVKRTDAEASANLQDAKAHYLKALQLSPGRTLEAFINTSLGNVCYWLNDYASAANYWRAAYNGLENNTLQSWVLYRIGLCQQRLGQWGEADRTFAAVQQGFGGTEAAARARTHQGYRAFYVQVAAFQSATSAERLMGSLRAQGLPTFRQERPERKLQVVLVGPMKTYADATAAKDRLRGQYRDAMVMP
ncbi:MAG: SPOR domain-containing protein [Bacillota bacterium]